MRALLFDLDDTLVLTEARVRVVRDGVSFTMPPSEFTRFDRLPGDSVDFSEFDDLDLLMSGRIVEETSGVLAEASASGVHVGVVTARNIPSVVDEFLRRRFGLTVPAHLLHAVSSYPGSTVPEKKAVAFSRMMGDGYTEFVYYEDCVRNARSVQAVCEGAGCVVHPYIVDVGPPVSINRLDGRTPPSHSA